MNLKLFKKRLIAFYSSWTKSNQDLWANSDVIVIYNPPPPADSPENHAHQLSSQFLSWLLGRDFHNTIVVFTRSTIYFICPKKKISALKTLKYSAAESVQARIAIHRKEKDSGDYGFALMDEIIRSSRLGILERGEIRPIVIGGITSEYPNSKLLWSGANPLKYRSVGVEIGVRKLLSHGDCVRVQMECLPGKFEEMLNMAKEGIGKVEGENKVFGEKEKGKESQSSGNCGSVSDELDDGDWVLVGEEEKGILLS